MNNQINKNQLNKETDIRSRYFKVLTSMSRIVFLSVLFIFNSFSSIAQSGKLATKTVIPLPSTPDNFAAKAVSLHQINLKWEDVKYENGYRIEYTSTNPTPKLSATGTSVILLTAEVGGDVTTYASKGLKPGTTYYYRIKALGSIGGSSPYSKWIEATTYKLIPMKEANNKRKSE